MNFLPIIALILIIVGVQYLLQRRAGTPTRGRGRRSAVKPNLGVDETSTPKPGSGPAVGALRSYAVVLKGPDLATPEGAAATAEITLDVREPGKPPRTVVTATYVPDGKWAWLTPGLRIPVSVAIDGTVSIDWGQL